MARNIARLTASALALATMPVATSALDLDTTSTTSIAQVAGSIASSIINSYYNASSTAGDFDQPEPWFWWLSGSGWTALMDYTVVTNDTTHKDAMLAALAENIGESFDFAPAAQSGWEANDDQMYWVYSALTALEYGLDDLQPCTAAAADAVAGTTCANSWLSVATNAFNTWVSRWEGATATCGGGLKWQYSTTASGYYYKNSVTNGGFFQTAARLARYTGNSTYAEWAVRVWDWSSAVGLVTPAFAVVDGASDRDADNCSTTNGDQWSYNVATYLHGAANMYAYAAATGSQADQTEWEARVAGLIGAANTTFFSPPAGNATGVMYEQKCELTSSCSIDQTSFKSSLSRWLGKTAMLVPSAKDGALALLSASAKAAASSCADVSGSLACGMKWWTADGFDGYSDFGSMLSALEVVQSLLVTSAPTLATLSTS